jgi:hypothetical protein
MRLAIVAMAVASATPAAAQESKAAPAGRIEAGLSYVHSFGDEPIGYNGAVLDASYTLLDTLGLGLSFVLGVGMAL